jgi:serine O-acetyltransferase
VTASHSLFPELSVHGLAPRAGIVIGETAVLGDNCSLLHHVTLGGSGTGKGMRHPVVGNGVLLGAGVSVLGPVVVGHCSKIGAGSVVATDLPPHVVAVGVPARVIKRLDEFEEPVKLMDQVRGCRQRPQRRRA